MAEGGLSTILYPPSRRVKSEVWKYFGFRTNAQGFVIEDGFPICKKCGRKIAAKQGNTSNMFAHIRTHHPLQFRQITMSLSNKETRLRARVNDNPFARSRFLAERRQSSNDNIEMSSQWQHESSPNGSQQTDCSSVTQESPESSYSWVKQEPKSETIEWENISLETPTDAEQDNMLSNAISSTSLSTEHHSPTQMKGSPTFEMLTITKLQRQLENKQEKIDALEKQVQDLQEDRKFLRTQIENLTRVLTARFCDDVGKCQEK